MSLIAREGRVELQKKSASALWAALAALALVALGAVPGYAQVADQGAVKDRHGGWDTRCESPPGASHEQCAIVQSVAADDRPNITLVLIALNTADRRSRLLRVIAPLGVLLPNGLLLKVDDEKIGRLEFVRCLPNGCVAEAVLQDPVLEKLKNGKVATINLFETPEEGIGVPASLAGFKEGFEQLP